MMPQTNKRYWSVSDGEFIQVADAFWDLEKMAWRFVDSFGKPYPSLLPQPNFSTKKEAEGVQKKYLKSNISCLQARLREAEEMLAELEAR